jgi:hypothetical protein
MLRHTLAMLALSPFALAQMSGAFTIDPNGSGTTNFKSFDQACKALYVAGVNGPVEFHCAPGTYTESVFVPPISGVSATNTVTFHSVPIVPAVLKGSFSNTFTFMSFAGYTHGNFVFDGLTFDSAPGFAIFATNNVPNIEIKNCTFGPNHRPTSSSEFRHALIVKDNNDTNEAGWKLHHNKMTFPNKVGTRTNYGVYMQNCGRWEIHHNEFALNGVTRGLYLINDNTSLDKIYNNLFYGDVATTTSTDPGQISVYSGDVSNFNNEVSHNTFVVNVPGASACVLMTWGTGVGRDTRSWGNIFHVTGPGVVYVHNQYNSSPIPSLVSNGNCFWVPNGDIGRIGPSPGTPYTTLAQWQTAPLPAPPDSNSIQADPLLISTTTPFILRPLPNSPAKDAATGTPSYVTDDYTGRVRDAKPDMGAYELSGFAPFGTGCQGTGAQSPVLSYTGTPQIGSSNFILTLANARPSSPAGLIIGFSNTTYGPIKLPYDLRGGCLLYISPDVTVNASTSANGTILFPFPIANNPGYFGLNVYFQWVVVDPQSVSSLGITVSNAGSLNL